MENISNNSWRYIKRFSEKKRVTQLNESPSLYINIKQLSRGLKNIS